MLLYNNLLKFCIISTSRIKIVDFVTFVLNYITVAYIKHYIIHILYIIFNSMTRKGYILIN